MEQANEENGTPANHVAEKNEESVEHANYSEAREQENRQETIILSNLTVSGLRFAGCSPESITLSWPNEIDSLVREYVLLRKELSRNDAQWQTVARIPSGGAIEDSDYQYTDVLSSTDPVQYCYCIEVKPIETERYEPTPGNQVIASNVCICIDPGHYQNSSPLRGSNLYGYNEGTFMLQVGLKLRELLMENYGIDCRMTRDSDHITLYGYSDAELDQKHLSLRGEYSEGCRLFLSLHTNANQDNVNGYDTCNQPIGITKTVIIVNRVASQSELNLLQANAIGRNLSLCNAEMGFASVSSFNEVNKSNLLEWTDAFNDSLNTPGTVCVRWKDNGDDYYGVLRGAASVGVPGIIIEHGHHTVAEMRREATQGKLADAWAEADAAGIAEGYHFVGFFRKQ